jgi:octaprenyl-diphosphate synthase
MERKTILEYLGDDWIRTGDLIRSSLDSDIELLNWTNGYILEHAGKQLRPMLSLLMARACGTGTLTGDTVRYAAAVELLHNATLLHDDVADGSKTRRGVPTVASILDPTHSVLLGDYWLVKAVGLVLDADDNVMEVVRLFADTLTRLAEGEMFQLQKASSGDTSEEDYLRIIGDKTGSLFETACLSAAISVGASAGIRQVAREYARNLGLAFQIKDDILDYDGGDIGKPAGVDVRERKITLPLLGALRNADGVLQAEIREKVRQVGEHPGFAEDVIGFVRDYGGTVYAQERLLEFSQRAKESLAPLPDTPAKDFLVALATFTEERKR